MAPSAVMALDALPRTPHGKLDAKALPAPSPAADAAGRAEGAGGALPAGRTPSEGLVARGWGGLLGREGAAGGDRRVGLGRPSLPAAPPLHRLLPVLGGGRATRPRVQS